MDPVDKIVGIVERAIRGRLQLTPAEFDLFFADAAKESQGHSTSSSRTNSHTTTEIYRPAAAPGSTKPPRKRRPIWPIAISLRW